MVEEQAYLEVWTAKGTELVVLGPERATVGRSPANAVALELDPAVSRLHSVIERFDAGWCLRDLGSSNGTFVNGERVLGERRLRGGDELRVGNSRLVFRLRGSSPGTATAAAEGPPRLTGREHDVLVALCRPIGTGDAFTAPATVRAVARELVVGEAAVKFHLANLYQKFAISHPGEDRRARLANEAIRRGAVHLADLRSGRRE